ncbi:hypothetical protein ACEWY4_020398 [Coilia grayii]|uniref:WH2 domain-containing protein n=1 Tax=Coilia grayii TaxID=363190 RepID=A0ABD1JE48_9TELE
MDVLVEVCARYHLNPACHTLELLSSDGQPVAFKPNGLLGSLDVACALIKERAEEKLARKPAPKVPEKTIRLVVNYQRSQKTVVRVNPLVPLHALVPAICQKCEFDPAHVLLLRDSVSRHELDLNKSLSDLEIRELYAFDQSLVLQPKMASAPALNYYAESTCSTQSVSTVEKKGLLGFFKFNRRKSKALSGISSSLCVEARPSTLGQSQSAMNISRMSPKVELKKRRAPAPPPATPLSFSSLEVHPGSPSTSSLLKKRKAPVPPPTPASDTPNTTPTPSAHGTHSASLSGAKASSALAAAAATVVLPPVTAVRRAARQDDSASQLSGSSEESERAAALGSSSSSQADSLPSSHLDEAAVSSQDEGEEEEEEYEDEDEVEMEDVETAVISSQKLQQQPQKLPQAAQPVVVERLQHQPVQRYVQTPREPAVSEPKQQQQQQAPVQPQPQAPVLQQPQAPVQQQSKAPVQQNQKAEEQRQHDSERSSTTPDSSSTVSLRIEESDNNRHSAIDGGRQVPAKPRRTSLGDQTSLVASASPAPVDRTSHNASPDSFTDMPQHSWLHSAPPAGGAEVPVDAVETGSVSSSSGSFADQGYAASEGTAEDPCPLGSPADRSPPHAPRDVSSDSDEGCATWNSRTSSQDRYQNGQSGKIKDTYKEDPKLMAQLQLTLADLDAELAEMTRNSECPSEADDVIPVSLVDLVPVTTIDEVIDAHLYSNGIGDHDSSAAQLTSNTQNNNNNATLCPEPVVQPRVPMEPRGAKDTREVKQVASDSKAKKSKSDRPVCENEKAASPSRSKPAAVRNERICPASVAKEPAVGPPSGMSTFVVVPPKPNERCKITEMPASRFGTRTFTIVPTTAAARSAAQTKASLSMGAIKIDEQGNMVVGGCTRRLMGTPAERREEEKKKEVKEEEEEKAAAAPLQEKAKAFWMSAKKQEALTAAKMTTATAAAVPQKTREPEVASKSALDGAVPKPAEKPQPVNPATRSVSITSQSSSAMNGSLTSQVKESKPMASEPVAPAQSATVSSQEPRNLSFLKPQKRTSSQYMATALTNKYAVKPAAKAGGIQEQPEPEPPTPAQKIALEVRSITRTITINGSAVKGSSISTQVEIPKENGSFPAALKSPPTYRSHSFSKQTTEEPARRLGEGAGTACQVDSGVVNDKTKITTQVPMDRPDTKDSSPASQPGQNQEPLADPGVLPEPNQVSLFGPVKKFRPVIQKSVEKEESLHSSLMEAIQSGDSKERLKKVCEHSAGSSLKKSTLVEEENSHSALLSAIRASSSTKLKKTRSLASKELDRFRSSAPPPTAPPPASAPLPPPPPPPPAVAAPPPPRMVPASAGNAEQNREALLEAIRSGAGAKSLKRVPLPTKTLQVNGRLGTIQASRPSSQGC